MELGLRTSFYVPDCYIHSHLDGGDQNICIPLSKKKCEPWSACTIGRWQKRQACSSL
jgi:hypothetical protein